MGWGGATCLPGCCGQVVEHVLSLAHQKLRGTAQQKLPMDMLVLEDEKHHGAQSPALQKVKVSVRRTQPPAQGTGQAVMALLPLVRYLNQYLSTPPTPPPPTPATPEHSSNAESRPHPQTC